jgi:hypothetical protein
MGAYERHGLQVEHQLHPHCDSWMREQLKDSDFRKAYRQERNAIFLAYKVAKLVIPSFMTLPAH